MTVIFEGGLLIDGMGSPARSADVIVEGSQIVGVGRASEEQRAGAEVISIDGLAVAPGFIDLHTHCDFTIFGHPRADSMVRQGVTTIVMGNCGFSPFPIHPDRVDLIQEFAGAMGADLSWEWRTAGDFMAALESLPLGLNLGVQVGHGALRVAAMGFDQREPTDAELDSMCVLLAEALDAGAFGFSSGLIYAPGTYAGTAELVALAEVTHERGGIYSTHMRNEGEALLDSIDETLEIARATSIRTQISHHKVLGRRNWGLTERSLEVIDAAIDAGLDVACDQYPYEASSTNLSALLPSWVLEGGAVAMVHRLKDEDTRRTIRNEVLHGPPDGGPHRDFEPDTLMLASVADPEESRYVGTSIAQVAQERGQEPVDVFLDLLANNGMGIMVVIFAIGTEDIERVMRHPAVCVASDGRVLHPESGGTPHPRSYGTFVRVLGHYVRELGVLTLEEAVRKMTSAPAARLNRPDLGVVKRGARADLVVFDPGAVVDQASFTEPHQFAAGIPRVMVGGHHVIIDGADTGAPAGDVLRRS